MKYSVRATISLNHWLGRSCESWSSHWLRPAVTIRTVVVDVSIRVPWRSFLSSQFTSLIRPTLKYTKHHFPLSLTCDHQCNRLFTTPDFWQKAKIAIKKTITSRQDAHIEEFSTDLDAIEHLVYQLNYSIVIVPSSRRKGTARLTDRHTSLQRRESYCQRDIRTCHTRHGHGICSRHSRHNTVGT